jgi:hypothetical protein
VAPRGKEPKGSNASKDWFQEINLAEDLINFKKTRNTALSFSNYPEKNLSSTTETKKQITPSSDAYPQSGTLSHRSSAAPHAASLLWNSAVSDDAKAASFLPKPTSPVNTYWDSTEAKKIFQPSNEKNNALEAGDKQMELLLCVLESLKGYWKVISHDGEAEYEVTDYQKWLIHL